MPLCISRRPLESLMIGDDIEITIAEVKGKRVKVRIDAPSHLRVSRHERHKTNGGTAHATDKEQVDVG